MYSPALQHIYTESGLLRGVRTYTPFSAFLGGLIDPNIKNKKGKKGITLQKKKTFRERDGRFASVRLST